MTTLVFPGQFSQKLALNKNIRTLFKEEIMFIESLLDIPLRESKINTEIYETWHCYQQVIIFLKNHLNYLLWKKENPKQIIDFVCGHSIGELNALVVADCIDFETAAKLIKERNIEMNKITQGKMMAVLGLSAEKIESILEQSALKESITVSVHNSEKFQCISYPKDKEAASIQLLHKNRAHIMLIPRLGPYHSEMMEEAEWEFGWALEDISFKYPKIPVLSNYKAIPYTQQDARINLYKHLTQPVLWKESIDFLKNCGENTFVSIGNPKTLAHFLS